MADLTFTNKATERKSSAGVVAGKGDAHSLKVLVSATIELPASTADDTVSFGNIPSNARISSLSKVYWDDLDTTGATFDIGLGSVGSNITNDPVAFNDGLDVTSAGSSVLIKDIVNYGLPAWDLVSGQTTDPGGELVVYGSIVDAASDAVGTVTIEVLGYLD